MFKKFFDYYLYIPPLKISASFSVIPAPHLEASLRVESLRQVRDKLRRESSAFGAPPHTPALFARPKSCSKRAPRRKFPGAPLGWPPVNQFKLGRSDLRHELLFNPAVSLAALKFSTGI
jgi:hypothetical protein